MSVRIQKVSYVVTEAAMRAMVGVAARGGGGRKTKGIKKHKHKGKGTKKERDKHTAFFDFLDQLDF
jgi:hypothetical protein